MNRDEIIRVLEGERDRLNQAIAALGSRHGRKARASNGRRRHRSPEEKNRISAAMRKSWSKRKKK